MVELSRPPRKMHDYSVDKPEWVEILPGHFVYGNTREMDGYRRELAAM